MRATMAPSRARWPSPCDKRGPRPSASDRAAPRVVRPPCRRDRHVRSARPVLAGGRGRGARLPRRARRIASASACEIAASRSVSAKASSRLTRRSASAATSTRPASVAPIERQQPVGHRLGRIDGEDAERAGRAAAGMTAISSSRSSAPSPLASASAEPRDGAGLQLGAAQRCRRRRRRCGEVEPAPASPIGTAHRVPSGPASIGRRCARAPGRRPAGERRRRRDAVRRSCHAVLPCLSVCRCERAAPAGSVAASADRGPAAGRAAGRGVWSRHDTTKGITTPARRRATPARRCCAAGRGGARPAARAR